MRYALIILSSVLLSCASGMDPVPDVPDVEIQEVFKETPCIITITAPNPMSISDYPAFDENDPSGWAKEVRRIYKIREVAKDAEVEALRYVIEKHNLLEPKCSD